MQQSFSAVFFDCSGVIIDSNFHQFVSWKRLFEEEGVPFTIADFQMKVSGGTRESGIRAVMGNIADERIRDLSKRKQEIFDKLIAVDVPGPFPGIADLLSTLRARNIALAVTSSSRNAKALLKRAHLTKYFDYIETPEDNVLVFNERDLFLHAMGEMGKKPEECIVVEDAPSSIDVAKKLGAFVIGIAIIAPPEVLHRADRVVTHQKELQHILFSLCAPLHDVTRI